MQKRVVLITGGSSGIGRALAFTFGRAGARIAFTGRTESSLQQVSNELTAAGIENLPLVADVAIRADNERVVQAVIARFGQLDILINNAGITMRSLFADADPEVLRRVMDINFFGTVYATHYALPYIRQAKGSVIGISSIAGFRGLPVRSGYSASKFAMNGFLEALRTEMLYEGVHVLTACPGFTASNIRFTALGKNGQVTGDTVRDETSMMSAEEVADRILTATRQRKRTLILTTQGRLTVFLNKWLPGLMDKLVYNTLAKEKDSPLKR
ncbi:MAG: SDR family oxidoreductase [Cytophagaceae bacterium]|nr:SDR family oxidoreductase [Cytophagaceae bacterium]